VKGSARLHEADALRLLLGRAVVVSARLGRRLQLIESQEEVLLPLSELHRLTGELAVRDRDIGLDPVDRLPPEGGLLALY
jgi:hypothetical protein